MRAPAPRPRQRGFTLLELLITLALTTIALTGLLSMQMVTLRSNESSSRAGEAVAVAQQTLEEYRNRRVLDELMPEFGVTTLPINATLDTVAGRAGTTYNRELSVEELTAISNSLVRIRVVVTWTDDGAAAGAEGGILDHRIALEIVRTVEEQL